MAQEPWPWRVNVLIAMVAKLDRIKDLVEENHRDAAIDEIETLREVLKGAALMIRFDAGALDIDDAPE